MNIYEYRERNEEEEMETKMAIVSDHAANNIGRSLRRFPPPSVPSEVRSHDDEQDGVGHFWWARQVAVELLVRARRRKL